jgi:hypothetical protein
MLRLFALLLALLLDVARASTPVPTFYRDFARPVRLSNSGHFVAEPLSAQGKPEIDIAVMLPFCFTHAKSSMALAAEDINLNMPHILPNHVRDKCAFLFQ